MSLSSPRVSFCLKKIIRVNVVIVHVEMSKIQYKNALQIRWSQKGKTEVLQNEDLSTVSCVVGTCRFGQAKWGKVFMFIVEELFSTPLSIIYQVFF